MPKKFISFFLLLALIGVAGWLLVIRSFGYAEIKVEYKGQPVTFGRHYICYNRISYDIAFVIPHNFRMTVSRSGNLATTTLPDGKQLIARLPQSCGLNPDTSSPDNTTVPPALLLADKPDKPSMLTFFVSAPELERGIEDLRFISMHNRFSSMPSGFSPSDRAQAAWYVNFGNYNVRREVYYRGNICSLTQLKDIPEQRLGRPFFTKSRALLQSMTGPTMLDSEAAAQASFDLSLIHPSLDLLKYDLPAISHRLIPIDLREGVRYVQPDLAGTIKLYAQQPKANGEKTYTVDIYGKRITTHFRSTGFYLPETESLLTCEDTGL